ncbi:MAG: Rrf2 family transcriptional regulator [Firmicutes bacterium HGW-Firmicutes-1]|jgi:Rrf2 family protein|nr:MAG: Rrf2 family transcriptional regulator [Firmicutes bacterium HGW-Firmicutes-1]
MKLSTKGRYGLRAMIDLAINSKENQLSIKIISERQNISENYLEQIIAILKKNGFVKSCRGAQGGYSLTKEPADISVGDILRALEGDLNPVDCITVNEDVQCSEAELCVTKYVWKRISDSINEVVDNISLEDLVHEQERIDACNPSKQIIKS